MIASFIAVTQLRVTSVPDNGMGVLIVSQGRHQTRIVEDRFVDPSPNKKWLQLSEEVRFGDDTYFTDSLKLVSKRSKESIEFPMDPAPNFEGLYAPGLRCLGGYNLGKSSIWIYAWKNFDIQLDPAVLVTAFEVVLVNGRPKVLRKAHLPAMVGYGDCYSAYRLGGHLIFTNASRSLSVFDLATWREVRSYLGSTYLSLSGRMYRIEGHKLSRSTDGITWKFLRNVDLGYLVTVHHFGQDDILEFDSSLMLGKSGQIFQYESNKINGQQPQVFVDPKLGAGVVWDTYSSGKGPVGTWLDLSLRKKSAIWPR